MQKIHQWGRGARLAAAVCVSAALLACGGSDDSSSTGADATGAAASGTSSGSATGSADVVTTAQQISAEAKQCIDLVKAERYADAIAPCEKAMNDSSSMANADVQAAYAEAKQKVKDEAQNAAIQAGADSLNGEDPGDAAKKAGTGMLKNLGGN